MGRVLFNRIFAPFAKVPVDERSLDDGLKFLNRFFPVLNRQLEANQYIAGKEFSLADISLLATIDPAEVAGLDLTRHAALQKWYTIHTQKDFYTKCHTSYSDVLKKMMSGVA